MSSLAVGRAEALGAGCRDDPGRGRNRVGDADKREPPVAVDGKVLGSSNSLRLS